MGNYQDISKYKTGKDFRLEFDNSLVANGYPSTGGYLTRRVTGVEIEWLVLDKMHEIQMSKEQAEEDNFCLRLRRLGAKLWENPVHIPTSWIRCRFLNSEAVAVMLLIMPF